MAREHADPRIIIEATHTDKVRAIQALVNLYRRKMPERMELIEPRAPLGRGQQDVLALAAKP